MKNLRRSVTERHKKRIEVKEAALYHRDPPARELSQPAAFAHK
jgi:hypothetical protein